MPSRVAENDRHDRPYVFSYVCAEDTVCFSQTHVHRTAIADLHHMHFDMQKLRLNSASSALLFPSSTGVCSHLPTRALSCVRMSGLLSTVCWGQQDKNCTAPAGYTKGHSRFEEHSKTASCRATYSDVFPSNLQQRTGGKHLALRRAPAFAPQLAFPETRNRQRRHRVATRGGFRLEAFKFGLHHFTGFTASAGSASPTSISYAPLLCPRATHVLRKSCSELLAILPWMNVSIASFSPLPYIF